MRAEETQKEERKEDLERKEGQIGPENSIYIGDLPSTITESDLYKLFSSVGNIYTITIPRKEINTKDICYAYITFFDVSSVEKAIENLNFYTIKGHQIRVMPLNKEKAQSKRDANVVVKNLPKETDNQMLYDTFSRFGKITSCKVQKNAQNECKGVGYIQFEDARVAKAAIDIINNLTIGEKKQRLSASLYIPSSERQSRKEEINKIFTNVYVKNYPEGLEEKDLRKVLEKYGELTSFCVPRNEDGKMKGFLFANYAQHENAVKAIESLHGKPFPGREEGTPLLYIQRAKQKSEREEELAEKYMSNPEQELKNNIYITNIPIEATDEKILSLFSKYGTIISHLIEKDEKTKRGYGYICYETEEQAADAIEKANRIQIEGNTINVTFFKSKRARDMEKAAQQMYNTYGGSYPHRSKKKVSPQESTNAGYELYTLILSHAPSFSQKIAEAGFSTDEEFAKKITGMIIDLGPEEVNSVSSVGNILSDYVNDSLDKIIMHQQKRNSQQGEEQAPPGAAQKESAL